MAEAQARTGRSAAATTERILEAARELFYAQGIRATSADRLIERVGITKVTFYRHFRTKGDLVVAYLRQQSAAEQAWMTSLHVDGDPRATLRALAEGIGATSADPGFRGCAFINAAAELADPQDPARVVVAEHRLWVRDYFAAAAAEAGADDPLASARRLVLLRDGAMIGGCLGEAATVAASLAASFEAELGPSPAA